MQDLRKTYTHDQRMEFQHTLNNMRVYLYPMLFKKQGGTCALCPSTGPFDIDHLVYNPLLTIKELRLLCWPCHKEVTWG